MDLSLEGRVILVTGGANGIGASIVAGLCREDARPVILDLASPDTAPVFSLVPEDAPRPDYHQLDLRHDDGVRSAVEKVVEQAGRIDGVVNNAGVNDSSGIDRPLADFAESLEKNLFPSYSLVHHVAAHLRRTRGAIVNIGSKVALTGQGGTSGYAAAKGALTALTREWALDFAADEVRCNAVVPAEVWTTMYERWLSSREDPKAARREIEARIPLGNRFTLPDEIAAMTLFLLSPRSTHTTGQIIHVDGGYTHLDRAYATPPTGA